MSHEHVVVWRYLVRAGDHEDFERAYGPAGPWPALFDMAEGYRGTTLLRSSGEAGAYLTIDRWGSREHYERFLEQFTEAYEELDRELEGLAQDEARVGSFDVLADVDR